MLELSRQEGYDTARGGQRGGQGCFLEGLVRPGEQFGYKFHCHGNPVKDFSMVQNMMRTNYNIHLAGHYPSKMSSL